MNGSGTHVYSSAHHCIASVGRFIITYSTQPPDAKYFQAWHAAVAAVREQQAGLLSVVTIIDSNAPAPGESSRKLMSSAMQRYAHSIERFAYVVEGRGFIAAAVRSAISLVNLAVRTPYRQKVFASAEEAGAWLTQALRESGSGMDPRALSELARSMRERVNRLARAV